MDRLHSLCPMSSPQILYSLQTRGSRPTRTKSVWMKTFSVPRNKDQIHFLEQFLLSSTSLTTKGESGVLEGGVTVPRNPIKSDLHIKL